jgi:hypothetical protein
MLCTRYTLLTDLRRCDGESPTVLVVVIKWAPDWLGKGLSAKDRAEELGRVRTALLAAFAGALPWSPRDLHPPNVRAEQAGPKNHRTLRMALRAPQRRMSE